MSAYNITPIVKFALLIAWIAVTNYLILQILGSAGTPLAIVVGVVGGIAVLWLMSGERVWLDWDAKRLVFKPRGWSSVGSHALKSRGGDSNDLLCQACGRGFKELDSHFQQDNEHYCPQCSQIGQVVMENYRDWFETTEEVYEK